MKYLLILNEFFFPERFLRAGRKSYWKLQNWRDHAINELWKCFLVTQHYYFEFLKPLKKIKKNMNKTNHVLRLISNKCDEWSLVVITGRPFSLILTFSTFVVLSKMKEETNIYNFDHCSYSRSDLDKDYGIKIFLS